MGKDKTVRGCTFGLFNASKNDVKALRSSFSQARPTCT